MWPCVRDVERGEGAARVRDEQHAGVGEGVRGLVEVEAGVGHGEGLAELREHLREMWGDAGRCGEMWGGLAAELRASTLFAESVTILSLGKV